MSLAARCDYCSKGIKVGEFYYRSVREYTDFYCPACVEHAEPREDYRRAISPLNQNMEFIMLTIRDYEALSAGLTLKDEENSVMDPKVPCRRRRDDDDV